MQTGVTSRLVIRSVARDWTRYARRYPSIFLRDFSPRKFIRDPVADLARVSFHPKHQREISFVSTIEFYRIASHDRVPLLFRIGWLSTGSTFAHTFHTSPVTLVNV